MRGRLRILTVVRVADSLRMTFEARPIEGEGGINKTLSLSLYKGRR